MEKRLKLYGERNTNTNYLSKLIQLNLNIQEVPGVVPEHIKKLQNILIGREWLRDIYFDLTYNNNLGWKHTHIKSAAKLKNYSLTKKYDIAFVSITKNPYSWLMSLYRNPYHQYYKEKPSFETFLQIPWKTIKRDNSSPQLTNPIELWNIKNTSYLQLRELNGINITTENIFADPEAVINQISTHFSIEKIFAQFKNYEQSTKNTQKDSLFYQNYYTKELWKEKISSEAISIINKYLDKELMAHFEYKII